MESGKQRFYAITSSGSTVAPDQQPFFVDVQKSAMKMGSNHACGPAPATPDQPGQGLFVRRLADSEVERVGAVLGLARLYQGNGFYLIAWQNEEPLGHAYLALLSPPELQDVQVRPEYRRRGVASALTVAAEENTLSLGFDRLRLEVSQANAAAQALYRGRGFADIGAPPRRVHGTVTIRTGVIEVDDTLLTWEKTLAAHNAD